MEPEKEKEMATLKKLSEPELAQALQLEQSDVASYVMDNEAKADDSGHWVYFRLDTPEATIKRLGIGEDFRLDLKPS